MISDTDAQTQALWLRLQREQSPSQQLDRALEMTVLVRSLFAANLRWESPGITQAEINRRMVAAYYGEECALRAYGPPPDA